MTDTYEIYAIKYAHHDRPARENFLGGDPHDLNMPLDYFVWAIVGVYLLLEASWHERRAGAFVLLVALLVATYAILHPSDAQAITPLAPVLRSTWLQIHVLATLVGYGALGVAAGLGLMQLWRRMASPNGASWQQAGISTGTPSRAEIERTRTGEDPV